MGRKSKNQLRIEKSFELKGLEEKRIKEILVMSNCYSTALHPLIEMYLDAHEIYCIKYLEWKDIGFKSTKKHKNKSGAVNEIKHPVAQQVEVWADKKSKLLNQLGLDAKNPKLAYTGPLINNGAALENNTENKQNKLLSLNQMRG